MRFAPALAVLVTGLALYVTRGVLDQVVTEHGAVRVALLPPWQALAGFTTIAALGLLWLDRRTTPRGTTTAVRPALGPLVLPALGLLVLLLPYAPVLPDRLPTLQMLAGPLRAVVWLAVIGQLLWVLWQSRLLRADWLHRWTLNRLAVAVGLTTALVSGVAAARFTGSVLYPSGDEPHYLVIAQSLWRDGDLKIENNHARRDYSEYFARDLAPHYLTRGADGEIYSIHPIGMPVIMAPVYAAGGYRAVVLVLIVMASVAAALMWRFVVRVTNSAGAATFAWAAVALTTPYLYNSFAVYPEIPAALAAVIALLLTLNDSPARPKRWVAVGFACATLPWLSTKYAPMSAALAAIAIGRIVWPSTSGTATIAGSKVPWFQGSKVLLPLAAVLVPYGASLIGWFTFFYVIWGTPWPQAPYGDLVQTDIRNLVFGGPGLLFDQEYGLLPYAPVYVLVVVGLWAMWRQDVEHRRRALEIALTFVALLGTVGAFRIWWGGTASPGRPLTAGLLLLAYPIAMAFRAAPVSTARRAAHHLLLWVSVGAAGILFASQNGLLVTNRRDGTSSLLEYLSPRWPAWSLAPSFIYHEAPTALLHTGIWLLLATLSALALARFRTPRPGVASLAAFTICASALLLGSVIVPLVPVTPPWPRIDVRARARLPLLDEFDTTARPLGVEYSPLRLVSAADLSRRATLIVEPGLRDDPQPVRVLHNGRFSLPAGRYRIDIDWSERRTGETIALQIGRTGREWRSWNVEPRPGERWTTEFMVPVDASFVGLRGTPELENTIRQISITPLSIVDAARRPKVPTVIGASQYGPSTVFYYDDNVSLEPTGFWVWGTRWTKVSIHRSRTDVPLVLRIHSMIPNRLRIALVGWAQTIALQPEQSQDVEIPSGDREIVTLELFAEQVFVPMQIDPTSRDDRPLGVWIEIVQ